MNMNRLGLGVSTAILTGSMLTSCNPGSSETTPPSSTPETIVNAAELEAIIAPYAGCVIKNVVNTHETPQDGVGMPASAEREEREKLEISVRTELSKPGEQARNKYAQDDTYIWNDTYTGKLFMKDQLVSKDGGYTVLGMYTKSLPQDGNLTLYPRKGYKDGSKMVISVLTSTHGSGVEQGKPAGVRQDTVTRSINCGTLVLKNSNWVTQDAR